jgi:hypothetical protein
MQLKIDDSKKHFFSDMINITSNAKFLSEDQYLIASRDYLTVKLWDARNPVKPYSQIQVCDYLEKKLCDFYESE